MLPGTSRFVPGVAVAFTYTSHTELLVAHRDGLQRHQRYLQLFPLFHFLKCNTRGGLARKLSVLSECHLTEVSHAR